jgi:hypothetical protein
LRAHCLIRSQPSYRSDAFLTGLRVCGYDVSTQRPDCSRAQPGDVLVIWNRYDEWHKMATAFEARGGIVLVAENGYIGTGGVSPKNQPGSAHGMEYYALARHAHNGRGYWHSGHPSRWARLACQLAPWRREGGHVLVCANRSFGMPGGIMPLTWADDTARALSRATSRRIRVRYHPGNLRSKVDLDADLAGAHACVVWSSSAGVRALVLGIPVISTAPWWIAHDAAGHDLAQIETPPMPDRLPVFRRMAWAQWKPEEIATGEPIRKLCSLATPAVTSTA